MKNNFKFVVGAALALSLFVVSAASAAYTHSTTLKLGSRSTQVMALQQTLNMTDCKVAASGAGSKGMETSYFGPATKAAVQCFQRVNALGADGVVGAMTGAKLSAIVVTDSTLPAGCSSKTGYSTTTGIKCDTTTGTGTTTPTPGNLQGGAGDLTLDSTSTDVESDVEEGKTEIVLGAEAEANDSDIAITNVKVEISSASGSGSTRIEKYLDEVSVWLGDKKVGSVDADEFNKDGTTYTKSISLSGAVISEDDQENLYVAVTALSSVDEDTQTFSISISDVRYTDATGAILSADVDDVDTEVFGFDPEGEEDELTIRSSSENPEASTLKVDEDDKSDDFLVLAFDLEADEDSADIDVLTIPVKFDLTGTSATFGSVFNEVYAKVGSKEYKADRISASSATTGTYDVDFDDNFTVDSGDSEEVSIYVVLNKQSGNYALGSTIKATVISDDIEAEGADELSASQLNGTGSGKVHTLSTSTASVSGVAWKALEGGAGLELTFSVEAEDESVTVTLADLIAADTVTTTGTVVAPTLAKVGGDAINNGGDSYTVEEGDTAKFSLVYTNTGANGTNVRVTMATIAGQDLSDSEETSPLVVKNTN